MALAAIETLPFALEKRSCREMNKAYRDIGVLTLPEKG
jgi:hypothetical protein